MRTPSRVAYWTKMRALMSATLALWLAFAIIAVAYVPFDSPAADALSSLLGSVPTGYAWGCLLFFVASVLISWFCEAQDRLDASSSSSTTGGEHLR